MSLLVDLFRTRLLPAFVAALGASFIAAGLMSYVSGGSGDDIFTRPTLRPAPTLVAVSPSDPLGPRESATASDPLDASARPARSGSPAPSASGSATPRPSPSAGASGSPTVSPSASTAPTGSPAASAAPSGSSGPGTASPEPTAKASPKPTPKPSAAPRRATATRVVIPALKIDLPVIKPPGGPNAYPVCNVAMYLQNLSQPGEPGATYLYAHARAGMFLPILEASRVNNGRRMIGMLVQVYTSDNRQYLYEIYQVRRHQTSLNDAMAAKTETLWLQTSEGPRGTPGKTQAIARRISVGPADPKAANPVAKPVACG